MNRRRMGLCSISNTSKLVRSLHQDLADAKREELISTVFCLTISTMPDLLAAFDPSAKRGAFHTFVAANFNKSIWFELVVYALFYL